jgi:glycosyltransferase involved in cell wall biosynthesis
MKISYAITVCDELREIKRLVPFLLEHKRPEDEIIVLFDQKNGTDEVIDFLLPFNRLPHVQTWRGMVFVNDFAIWKNKLNDYCSGDYILQLDADEMITEELIKMLPAILESNSEVDLFVLPRINTVEGITEEHINKWGWKQDEQGRINFPDWQGRLYRKGLNWHGKVHEKIIGAKKYSIMPEDEGFCILHPKTIERQERQNNFYSKIQK